MNFIHPTHSPPKDGGYVWGPKWTEEVVPLGGPASHVGGSEGWGVRGPSLAPTGFASFIGRLPKSIIAGRREREREGRKKSRSRAVRSGRGKKEHPQPFPLERKKVTFGPTPHDSGNSHPSHPSISSHPIQSIHPKCVEDVHPNPFHPNPFPSSL